MIVCSLASLVIIIASAAAERERQVRANPSGLVLSICSNIRRGKGGDRRHSLRRGRMRSKGDTSSSRDACSPATAAKAREEHPRLRLHDGSHHALASLPAQSLQERRGASASGGNQFGFLASLELAREHVSPRQLSPPCIRCACLPAPGDQAASSSMTRILEIPDVIRSRRLAAASIASSSTGAGSLGASGAAHATVKQND